MRHDIRNRQGMGIGYITDQRSKMTASTWSGMRLGHYVPSTDTTYDARGLRMGRGNLLSALIWDAAG